MHISILRSPLWWKAGKPRTRRTRSNELGGPSALDEHEIDPGICSRSGCRRGVGLLHSPAQTCCRTDCPDDNQAVTGGPLQAVEAGSCPCPHGNTPVTERKANTAAAQALGAPRPNAKPAVPPARDRRSPAPLPEAPRETAQPVRHHRRAAPAEPSPLPPPQPAPVEERKPEPPRQPSTVTIPAGTMLCARR